jgi:hypothetical protein
MKRYLAVMAAVVFTFTIWNLPIASAQQASSFEQLQLLVKPGDKIEVTGTNGIKSKGRLESLTPATLRLTSKNGSQEFAQREAFEIKQKRSDSLGNGALIGGLVGGGFGGALAIAACTEGGCEGEPGFVAAVIFIDAGLGVAIGVGIDALIKHQQTIYRQPLQTAIRSIRLEPVLVSGQKGARLKFSF